MGACSLCRHDRPLVFCGELSACASCVRNTAAHVVQGGLPFVRDIWGEDLLAPPSDLPDLPPQPSVVDVDDVDDAFLARSLAEAAVAYAEAGAFDHAVVAAARSLEQDDTPPEPIAVQILLGALGTDSMKRLRDALFPA